MASDSESSYSSFDEEVDGHTPHDVIYKYNYRPNDLPYWFDTPFEFVKKKVNGYKILEDLEDDEIMYLSQEVCRRDNLTMLYLMVENGVHPKWLGIRRDECTSSDEAVSILNIVIESITDKQLNYVKYLVKAGWSVNAPPENERNVHNECYMYPSPLTSALKKKQHSVVKYLMDKGAVLADVELRCCQTFNDDMVRMMLQYKPKAEESTLRQILVRMLTCGSIRATFYIKMLCEVLEWIIPAFIDMGININTQPLIDHGHTPETFAENIMHKSILSDEDIPKALEILIKNGLDLKSCCSSANDSLLSLCVKRRSIGKTFEFLLGQGLNVNSAVATPLLHLTLRQGWNPKSKEYNGGYYYESGYDKAPGYVDDTWFPFLLELGADVNLEDSSGASLYDKLLCRHGGNNEQCLIYLLLKTEIKIKPSNLQREHFMNLKFVTLAALIHAGCRDHIIINAAWEKVEDYWESHRIQLLQLAHPLFVQIELDDSEENYSQAFIDILSVPSLQTWCVNAVHRHLFLKVTMGKSIIQKLNQVSEYLPKDLAGVLNFKTFYTHDRDIPQGLKEYLCIKEEPQPIVIVPKIKHEIIIIDSEVPSDLVANKEVVIIDSENESDMSVNETNQADISIMETNPEFDMEGTHDDVLASEPEPSPTSDPEVIIVIEPETHSILEPNIIEPTIKLEPSEDRDVTVIEQERDQQFTPATEHDQPETGQDVTVDNLLVSKKLNVESDIVVDGKNVSSGDINAQVISDGVNEYFQIVVDPDVIVKDIIWVSDSEIHVVV